MAITTNVNRKSALTNLGALAELCVVGATVELSVLASKLQNPGVSTPQRDHRLFCKAVKGNLLLRAVMLSVLIQHPLLFPKLVRAFRQAVVQLESVGAQSNPA